MENVLWGDVGWIVKVSKNENYNFLLNLNQGGGGGVATPQGWDELTPEEQAEFQVLEAKDGQEGIILAKKNIPDLIITDVMMPKIDGYQ